MCRTPELAVEVTLQPIRRFGFDAAILFSDILVPFEPMGLDLSYPEGGPRIANPVRSRRDVEALRPIETERDLPYVTDAVRLAVDNLGETPLIVFTGAPFTLASYAVEGGSSRQFAAIKGLMFSEPDIAHTLFQRLADMIVEHLGAQIAAGASAFQVFDSWGGMLSVEDYRTFALPYLRDIFARLRDTGVPGILFVNGGSHLLEVAHEVGSDVVGIDWRTDLVDAHRRLPSRALQGNLDPTVLFGSADLVRQRVTATLESGARTDGYIFNLGHGILPGTPPENVEVLLSCVRAFERASAGLEVGRSG
jgi:uroporphyrinogen decarboxylase